jgi:hypothetical protein
VALRVSLKGPPPVSADEERTPIVDHRENERYHHFTSHPLMEPRRQSKLLILYADRVLMTHSRLHFCRHPITAPFTVLF